MSEVIKKLNVIMADTYALYLKTQNYHWHVRGLYFKTLHELFEAQYLELAAAVDTIAERILTLGHFAPATFKEFQALTSIKDGDSRFSATEMLGDLAHDHDTLAKKLTEEMLLVQKLEDEGTANLLANRIESHEKARWMLTASNTVI